MARVAASNHGVLSASWRARTMFPTRSRTRKRARSTTAGGSASSRISAVNPDRVAVTPMVPFLLLFVSYYSVGSRGGGQARLRAPASEPLFDLTQGRVEPGTL